MIDRLNWMLAQLQRLEDNERVRSEGLADFRAVKNELVDVIATYTEPVAPPPAIVNQVFGPGELQSLGVIIATNTMDQLIADGGRLAQLIRAEAEQSDVAVLAAIAETRADVLAAVAPAA